MAVDPFVTIYRRDYDAKRPEPITRLKAVSEFPDPINESFKNYLQLSSTEQPPVPPVEDADKYLVKFKENHGKLADMYFKQPINNEIVGKTFIFNGRTVYQVDYCDLEKENEDKEELRKKNLFRLPDDWNVPLTTQTNFYRNPIQLNSRAYEQTPQRKPTNNLDPDENLRKIMKVSTGRTEYQRLIGKVGTMVMKDQLHGKIHHEECKLLDD